MLNRLPTPTQCPSLNVLLADIGNPAPANLAKALGVTEAEATEWTSEDDAPRSVLLSLFWLTRWGMSTVDAEAVNRARLNAGRVMALEYEIRRLNRELARVISLADFGAANDPVAERFA